MVDRRQAPRGRRRTVTRAWPADPATLARLDRPRDDLVFEERAGAGTFVQRTGSANSQANHGMTKRYVVVSCTSPPAGSGVSVRS